MKKSLHSGWQFLKLNTGSSLDNALSSDWQNVYVPHDWLIWNGNDLYESADAWYRYTLICDNPGEDVHYLCFDGVYMDCDVFLNREKIACHAYGYTSFRAEMTGKLYSGQNEIIVHIRHQSPNSRWYSGSGIYREVNWITLPPSHLIPDTLYIEQSKSENVWKTVVSAETAGSRQVAFSCVLRDAEGCPVCEAKGRHQGNRAYAEFSACEIHEWSPDSPYLYRLEMTYGSQKETLKTGYRELKFDSKHGLILNGTRTKLKGVCLHHDLGALGAAFHEKAARRQLMLMKSMGANALRTSHNPPARKLLDICDEIGMLVIDEAFDMWEIPKTVYDYSRFFKACHPEDVSSWISRDRCHPCVIMWSVGNEIYDMHAGARGEEITRELRDEVHALDPTHHAEVTFGCNYMPWEGGQRCAEIVGIPGYNYGEKLYADHHRKYPDWVIYGSETGSVLSSRGIYHFPMETSIMSDSDLQCSALGNSNTSWGADDLCRCIVDDNNTPFSMGQFIWSGIDYIGEPTPYHTRSCYFGQADTACFPKDSYYLFKSLWTDEKMIHIGVRWDWNPGQMIDIPVMTNCNSAELFLNGTSLGSKQVVPDDPSACLPVWKTAYVPGTLCAVGYDQTGTRICTDSRTTPEDTADIILSPEDESIRDDGHDIVFVTVQAADAEGRPVDNARDLVSVSVTGGGCLLGTDNGDSTDEDTYKSSVRRLFNGKLLLIIGSNGKNEDVQVEVCSSAGLNAKVIVPVQETMECCDGTICTQSVPFRRVPLQIPVRKIEIIPLEDTNLTKDHPECSFRWRIWPFGADCTPVKWEVTNASGIRTPFAEIRQTNDRVHVRLHTDGAFYLRALTGNHPTHPEIISQIEISAEGIGFPSIDPYHFVSAGLFDMQEGAVGSGNEKGIAFSREGKSMIGFSRVDFGIAGSDRLSIPIFALDDKPCLIELLSGLYGEEYHLITTLRYQKPSIWNTYQEETFVLPVRLTGIRSICFRTDTKIHMKGFCFEKQCRALQYHHAGEADQIYGDSFHSDGKKVSGIGNNVTLVFGEMEFEKGKEYILTVEGYTPLEKNTITVRMTDAEGNVETQLAEFMGSGEKRQSFPVRTVSGTAVVSFVFLPGSCFDFYGFRFQQVSGQ